MLSFEEFLFEKEFSEDERKALSKKGLAMEDGSFPIRNASDLKKAIKAHGRAKDVKAAKTFIKKRAKDLGRDDLIPSSWKASK